MKELYLISLINKYYLNGLTERVKLSVTDKTITINFITSQKNLVGIIKAEGIELENCEIGIYDTTQLLKLLNITDKFLILNVEKQGKVYNKLLIADKEYNLEYSLADIMLTPTIPVIEEPKFDMEADIDLDFINKFIKAKKALDTDIFVVEAEQNNGNNMIKFTLGGTNDYTNKVNFSIISNNPCVGGNAIKFPINEFKEILENNKDSKTGKLFISEQGLIKVIFSGKETEEITYFLVGKE